MVDGITVRFLWKNYGGMVRYCAVLVANSATQFPMKCMVLAAYPVMQSPMKCSVLVAWPVMQSPVPKSMGTAGVSAQLSNAVSLEDVLLSSNGATGSLARC